MANGLKVYRNAAVSWVGSGSIAMLLEEVRIFLLLRFFSVLWRGLTLSCTMLDIHQIDRSG